MKRLLILCGVIAFIAIAATPFVVDKTAPDNDVGIVYAMPTLENFDVFILNNTAQISDQVYAEDVIMVTARNGVSSTNDIYYNNTFPPTIDSNTLITYGTPRHNIINPSTITGFEPPINAPPHVRC